MPESVIGTPSMLVEVAGDALIDIWFTILPFSIFITLMLSAGIVYIYIREKQIAYEVEKQKPVLAPVGSGHAHVENKFLKRWESITAMANSENENDWRRAIIEADILLDELLDAQGYRGDTMGDKMKGIERSDFLTIDNAWEAHKMRNRIAHDGAALQLNDRDVRRTISLYEAVFREFQVI